MGGCVHGRRATAAQNLERRLGQPSSRNCVYGLGVRTVKPRSGGRGEHELDVKITRNRAVATAASKSTGGRAGGRHTTHMRKGERSHRRVEANRIDELWQGRAPKHV